MIIYQFVWYVLEVQQAQRQHCNSYANLVCLEVTTSVVSPKT